jgi:hypothetical protein
MPKPPPTPERTVLSLVWRELGGLTRVLTDLSFREFVTPKIIRTVYLISLIGAGLASLTWMFSGFKEGVMNGLFTFVTGPVAFFFYLLTARVGLEVMLAIFRIAENTEKLREKSDRRDP